MIKVLSMLNILGCLASEFACPREGICIPRQKVCDGNIHCSDGKDEENCNAMVTKGNKDMKKVDSIPKYVLNRMH